MFYKKISRFNAFVGTTIIFLMSTCSLKEYPLLSLLCLGNIFSELYKLSLAEYEFFHQDEIIKKLLEKICYRFPDGIANNIKSFL